MRSLLQRKQFRKDYKLQKRRNKNIKKLKEVVSILIEHGNLPAKHHPHILSGEYNGLWECHIESDWLLIYDITDTKVILVRTGTHADLFE